MIEVQLENDFKRLSKVVIVNGQQTKELYNVNYTLNFADIERFLNAKYKAASEADRKERENIITQLTDKVGIKQDDLYTRQLVLQPKYDNTTDLAACVSFVQIIFRNDQIDLHVVIRSQNFDKNFMYDNQTYCICLNNISSFIKKKRGKIYVKVISLHKII